MLDKLSENEIKLMNTVKQEWLDSFNNLNMDEELVKKQTELLYQMAGLSPPLLILCDSPIACQKKAMKLTGSKEYTPVGSIGTCDHGWLAFYDFFERIGIIKHELFSKFRECSKTCIHYDIQFDEARIVSRPPVKLLRDEEHKLHCETGPAIAYSDGYELFFVDGLAFPKDLFEHAFINKDLTGSEVMAIKNTEQRTKVMKSIGYEKFVKELGAVLRDTWVQMSRVDGKPCRCELYDVQTENFNWRLLIMEDHTTHKRVGAAVPSESLTESVRGALAWVFGFSNADDYAPEVES